MATRTAKKAAATYLARREHSEHELRQKLARQYDADEIEHALAALRNEGLLCDERFVDSFMRTAAARYGRAKLHQQLCTHHIDPQLINKALDSLPDDVHRAIDMLQQKYKVSNVSEKQKQQAGRFLLSRGFGMDDIEKAISSLWGECFD